MHTLAIDLRKIYRAFFNLTALKISNFPDKIFKMRLVIHLQGSKFSFFCMTKVLGIML